jgi:transcriptional regulator of acetoin/glycerol metabolism
LLELLRARGGNVQAVARALGVSRSTLYRWLEAAGIAPDRAR